MGGFQNVGFVEGAKLDLNNDEIIDALNGIKSAIGGNIFEYSIGSLSASKTIESSTSTTTDMLSVSLTKGLYILQSTTTFNANSTGLRSACIRKQTENLPRIGTDSKMATSNFLSRIEVTRLLYLEDNTTVYVSAMQGSGSPLITNSTLDLIKLM